MRAGKCGKFMALPPISLFLVGDDGEDGGVGVTEVVDVISIQDGLYNGYWIWDHYLFGKRGLKNNRGGPRYHLGFKTTDCLTKMWSSITDMVYGRGKGSCS